MKKCHSELSKNEPVCRLGQEWSSLCEGGKNCLKYLKRGWKRGEWKQTFLKRGRQAGLRGGCLEKGEGCNPLTNYVLNTVQSLV